MKISAVIVAAGSGTRMKAGKNKVFLELLGKTVLEHTVWVFEECDSIDEIVVVTNDTEYVKNLLSQYKKVTEVVCGGENRGDSVKNGLLVATGDIVAIHDGARALIEKKHVEAVVKSAAEYGAAALGVKCKDTLKVADENGFISGTIDREITYNIQTPQVFGREKIMSMYEKCDEVFTDDCALFEKFGERVKIVEGSYENIKLTTPEDMIIAEKILKERGM